MESLSKSSLYTSYKHLKMVQFLVHLLMQCSVSRAKCGVDVSLVNVSRN